jgi:hypothetical protein
MFWVLNKLLLLIFLFTTLNTFATIRYVSKTGSSTPPYLSWDTAADSIQKCINVSSYGDTIYVGSSVYIEAISMINGLSIIGSGWDSCIIDTRTIAPSSGGFYAVRMQDNCLIEGFHIMVKSSKYGTGIGLNDNLTDTVMTKTEIKNNKFSHANTAIFGDSDLLIIRDNFIENCSYGMFIYGVFPSYQCFIYDNYLVDILSHGITTSLGAGAVIYNNIILMNGEMSFGITTPTQTPSYIYNNLVIQKYPNAIGSYGIFANNIPNVVMNNFVVNNFNTGIAAYHPSIANNNIVTNCKKGIEGDATIKYNNTWNNEKNYHGFIPDSTNLSVNPMVVNEEELDFHLQMFSPLIDAGDPDILTLTAPGVTLVFSEDHMER